jgi:hypothetical protein
MAADLSATWVASYVVRVRRGAGVVSLGTRARSAVAAVAAVLGAEHAAPADLVCVRQESVMWQ